MDAILEYRSLVTSVAGRVYATLPPRSVEFGDLVSAGTVGLLEAEKKFKPSRGFRFATYATWRIQGAIFDELRRMDWVPKSIRRRVREMRGVSERLEQQNFRRPTPQEVAEEAGMGLNKLYELLELTSRREELSSTPIDVIPLDTKLILAQEINRLPEVEQKVMHLYYYKDLAMKEIGKMFALTESRVSQIHKCAIEKLRKRLKGYL